MTSVEEGETQSEEVPPGNPDELAKNPSALKGLLNFSNICVETLMGMSLFICCT